MDLRGVIEIIGLAIDVLGVVVIVVAVALGGFSATRRRLAGDDPQAVFRGLRQSIGRGVLLGLELLVAGDIIRTVVIEPTFESVGVLGLIVLVRTFLSFSLEVELSGRWPWSRGSEGPTVSQRDG